jgi:hypothetical protein
MKIIIHKSVFMDLDVLEFLDPVIITIKEFRNVVEC